MTSSALMDAVMSPALLLPYASVRLVRRPPCKEWKLPDLASKNVRLLQCYIRIMDRSDDNIKHRVDHH